MSWYEPRSDSTPAISEVTRRGLFDEMSISRTDWSGRLTESEFLARLFDLTVMGSTDHRFRTAAADIRQHRENWSDWPDDWVFYDSRFNLLYGADDTFVNFLCETVHPVVRGDAAAAAALVELYNSHLRRDGWELYQRATISGQAVYAGRRIGARIEVFSEPTGWPKVDRQIQEARSRLDAAAAEEQYQAVGLICREALISVAQTVFDFARHSSPDTVVPSDTDAGRMLQAYFETELRGSANEEARAHAKAALKLAIALQHKRTANFTMAALCAEATASVINQAAILSGRRG
jgi:hypothetical protein